MRKAPIMTMARTILKLISFPLIGGFLGGGIPSSVIVPWTVAVIVAIIVVVIAIAKNQVSLLTGRINLYLRQTPA